VEHITSVFAVGSLQLSCAHCHSLLLQLQPSVHFNPQVLMYTLYGREWHASCCLSMDGDATKGCRNMLYKCCDKCCDMCCTELYHVLANHVYLEQWPRTKQQCHNGGWRECMKHIAVSDQRSVETSTLHRIYPYQRCILCGGNRQFAIDWPGQSAVNEEAFNQLCSALTCQHVPVAETAFSEHNFLRVSRKGGRWLTRSRQLHYSN
jgi:hypothetical protein